MRNSLLKMQYLLCALTLFALAACGVNDKAASTDLTGTGQVTAKVALPDGKLAKSVGLIADVVTVRLVVTGAGIPTAKGTPVPTGTNPSVEVYPGSDLTVAAYALNASGVVLYEGFVTGVTVAAAPAPATNVGTIQLAPVVVKATDSGCISCHESTRDVTGQNLVADYKQSGHYTNESWTTNGKYGSTLPGCAGCHGTQHNDPTPAVNGRCYECHGLQGSGVNNLNPRHTGVYVKTAANALVGNTCSNCHQSHNTKRFTGLAADWAASGHGDKTAQPWSEQDFSKSDTCNACHTAAGFVQAINSSWATTTAAGVSATGMKPLTCDGCHSNNDFKNSVRTISGDYVAGMGGFGAAAKATITYKSVGESNVCIPCHATRENGKSVALGVANFANASFKNPHYLGAAAVFYGQGGFQFYSSVNQTPYAPQAYTSKYGVVVDGTIIKTAAASTSNSTPAIAVGDALVGDKAAWSHGKLGMNNFQTTKTAAVVAAKGSLVYTGTKGQCVACHLGPKNTHSFGAFESAEATWVKTATPTSSTLPDGTFGGCYGCHTNENMKEVAELDEKPKFDASMDFFKWQLNQVGAVYTDVYPYFYNKAATPAALKNWIATDTAVGMVVPGGNGLANMGAAMNYKMLAAEKGAHVHNRTFMKQLIFDSIQYLQKGNVSFSHRYITSGSTSDPNGLIDFSNYSTSLIGTGKAGITTQTVRGYIVRKNTGSNGAIGTAAAPLYTRN